MKRRDVGMLAAAGFLVFGGGCVQDRGRAARAANERAAAASGEIGAALDSFDFAAVNRKRIGWDAATGTLSADGDEQRPLALFVHVFQPDCNSCQSQAEALEQLRREGEEDRVRVVGITHRGERAQAGEFVRQFEVGYPVAVGTGSEWAARWSRGDPMYVVDAEGKVVYSQLGFEETDGAVWRMVIEDLAAGREVAFRHPQRTGRRLSVGDSLPAIELPDLMTGRPMSLTSGGGALSLTDSEGRVQRCKVSIGFFSRY